MKNKINYCHFSLDKFYRHTRGFNESLLAEYLSLYVEYMETGKCSSITLAMQEYYEVRGIGEDFKFLYEKALTYINIAKKAANTRWQKETQKNNKNAQAMLKQCSSIPQAYANYNYNNNYNINNKIKDINTSQSELCISLLNEIFEYWNKQEIITHRSLETIKGLKSSIKSAIKRRESNDIKKAIDNYKIILYSDKYYWTHKWGLKDFLNRGLDKFCDEADPFNNFKGRTKENTEGNKQEILEMLKEN